MNLDLQTRDANGETAESDDGTRAHTAIAAPWRLALRARLRVLRFDGLWWRKFAYLGSVYGPEWWKRYSPPWIAAIIFCCVRRNRAGAVANMRRVLGRHGWRRDHWHGLQVFIAFAHCMNETLECFSPRPRPIVVDEPENPIRALLQRGRGVILVTCHFGNWDIAARFLDRFGVTCNLVMAREANDTTAEYVRHARENAGVRVLLSDSSVYSSFNILRALRRNEIVAMQLDRPLGGSGARPVDFFGAPALFQSGPLRLARISGAPVVAIYVARFGPRRYQIIVGSDREIPRAASEQDIDRALGAFVTDFENVVRQYPDQWFQFAPFWPGDGHTAGAERRPVPQGVARER